MTDKCKGCNNVKGCITCVDGSCWAHYEETISEDSEEAAKQHIEKMDFSNSGYKESSELIAALKQVLIDAFVIGADWKKMQMMKDAVHGNVDYPLIGYDFPNIYPNYRELKEYCDRHKIKDGNKVKLIIIKED